MKMVRLGATGLCVPKNGFGALPIQRTAVPDAVKILRRAYESGITYYDTARSYSDSEEKLGISFEGMRDKVIIATKTPSLTSNGIRSDLETSLRLLKTDYIDVYQLHNPAVCPRPGDGSGVYEELEKLVTEGKILHIGITNHRISIAREAVRSGLYALLQFPFSYLSNADEHDLVAECAELNVGFVAMKALSGGLISEIEAIAAFMWQYDNVLPIWGIQHARELEDFIHLADKSNEMTDDIKKRIESDRATLLGDFCRGCSYCMPCPAEITIHMAARMSLLIRRSPSAGHLSEQGQAMMKRIEDCSGCGACKTKCPYGLDTPELLKRNYDDYKEILAGRVQV